MKTKTLLLFCSILCLLIAIASPVFAGDIPESAMQYADFCIIGEVQNVENTHSTIKISEVVFGNYTQSTMDIAQLKFSHAPGDTKTPKKGDYCAIVVLKTDAGYTVFERLAAKSDSLDKKTLKLQSTDQFVKRMNNYINTGWYSNEKRNEILSRVKKDTTVVTQSGSLVAPPPVPAPTQPVAKPVKPVAANAAEPASNPILPIIVAIAVILTIAAGNISLKLVSNKRKRHNDQNKQC